MKLITQSNTGSSRGETHTWADGYCRRSARFIAFTLIEMLVVLAIIGLILALTLPNFKGMNEGKVMEGATRQLMSDLAFARQTAIATRSTVAVVFISTNVLQANLTGLSTGDVARAEELKGGCYTKYALIAYRQVGEQPGKAAKHYVTEWKSLPEKSFIAKRKMDQTVLGDDTQVIKEALEVDEFPFPRAESPNVLELPYIAFDHRGHCINVKTLKPKYVLSLPLARGVVINALDANQRVVGLPTVQEIPPGNSDTNLSTAVNIIHIDWNTGRAKLERGDVLVKK